MGIWWGHQTRTFTTAGKALDLPLDTGDDGVGVWSLFGPVISLLDDNDLFPGLTTRQDDGNLARLVD